MQIILFYILIALLLLPATVLGWSGQVTHVTDGDTFDVMYQGKETTIRLYGIDCPELDQLYGQKAKQVLEQNYKGERVEVEKVDVGPYGRTLALVNGGVLNAYLIHQGLAWVYDKYCNRYYCVSWAGIEDRAKRRGIGLWSRTNPTPPWEWRH